MNWFRVRVRSAAQLALFALAVQMVLSFGHLHRDDLGLPPLPTADQTRITVDSSGAPAPQDHNQKPDDYCPICASMALIATAVPSLPPAMIVPEPIQHVWSEPASAVTVTLDVRLSFRARAPPMV